MGDDKEKKQKAKDKKPAPFRNGAIFGLVIGAFAGLIIGWSTPGLKPGFVDEGKQALVEKASEAESKARQKTGEALIKSGEKISDGDGTTERATRE